MGFEGLVMTDWFGEDAVAQINAGNDLIEPGTKNNGMHFDANAEGSLEEPIIDRAAARI